MAASSSPSPSEESTLNTPPGVRHRVTKACQRCRLKKCKCDGISPCARCMADDAICSYGRHKKSDKTVYRKGYVQMLERQHSQLIAGVHEMYKLGQQGNHWPDALRQLAHHIEGQPLTHQILEALGVLRCSPQDEADDPNGDWRLFQHHPQDDGVMDDSAASSPALTNARLKGLESIKPPISSFHSTKVQQQYRSRPDRDHSVNMQYYPAVPPLSFASIQSTQASSGGVDLAYLIQQQQQTLPNPFLEQQTYDEALGLSDSTSKTVNWNGLEDMFDFNASSHRLPKSG